MKILILIFICHSSTRIFAAFNQYENQTIEKEISRKKRDACSDEDTKQVAKTATDIGLFVIGALVEMATATFSPASFITNVGSKMFELLFDLSGSSAPSTCDLMVKLDEILNKLDIISNKIDALGLVVECVSSKANYKNLKDYISRLENTLAAYNNAKNNSLRSVSSPAGYNNELEEDLLRRVASLCNDNSEGIDKILSLFQSFFFDEDEMSNVFKNCAQYESKKSGDWINNMKVIFIRIITLIKFCSDANRDYRFIDHLKQLEKQYNLFVTYYVEQLIPEMFANDAESSVGIKAATKQLANEESSATKLCETLKEKFAYFDWTVIMYSQDVYGTERHYAKGGDSSFASGAVLFKRDLNTKKNALIGWHLARAKRPVIHREMYNSIFALHDGQKEPNAKQFTDIFFDQLTTNNPQYVLTLRGDGVEICGSGYMYKGFKINVFAALQTKASKVEKPKCSRYAIFFDITEKNLMKNKIMDEIQIKKINEGFFNVNESQRVIKMAISSVDIAVREEGQNTRNVLNSGFSDLSKGQDSIRNGIQTGFNATRYIQDQIRLDIAEVDKTVKTEHAQTRKQMQQGFIELQLGQSLNRQENKDEYNKTRQELRQGLDELKIGQIEIKQNVEEVQNNLKIYGERGIEERAQILANFSHYGVVGIEQRMQIIKDLSELRNDIGDISTKQLEESYKSSLRYDYLKDNLHAIQNTIIDEAKISESRHNNVAGGINDLRSMHVTEANNSFIRLNIITSGIHHVKNHLGIESQKSAERFGVLNYGIERIMNHNLIESQINERRFATLDNGVNDIRNIQVRYFQFI